jgi:uncharacterized membrane protein
MFVVSSSPSSASTGSAEPVVSVSSAGPSAGTALFLRARESSALPDRWAAEPQAKEGVLIAELGATDWGVVARAIHVLAVVVWIGSVWLVTTVLLPGMKNKAPADWVREFDVIEYRFAPQARIAVLLVLLSGLYMLYQYDLWDRFTEVRYWWMDLMVAVWLLFALMLFAIGPFVFRHVVHKRAEQAPEATLALMLCLHRVLLTLSLIAIFAAVGGSQGLF